MTPEGKSRADDTLDLLIVGAGFGGLCMLHKARAMGLSVLVLEAAPSVGGTWYANRYPGARVDIQSLEYSFSFSEALQQEWQWTERYASPARTAALRQPCGGPLRPARQHPPEHSRDVGPIRGRPATLGARQRGRGWSGADLARPFRRPGQRAAVDTEHAGLPRPGDFRRADPAHGGLAACASRFRRSPCGVIGTGSSAVQVIPRLAQQAASVTVFQRTAAYVAPAHNGPLDPTQEARVKADYPRFRARNRQMRTGFGCDLPMNPNPALAASPAERDSAFEARWRVGGFSLLGAFGDLMTDLRANALAAEFVRGKIRQAVHDPATAALLSPHQPIGCKRMCVADDYYETFNRPNVQLVDVSEKPIKAITPGGLRTADGREHTFDIWCWPPASTPSPARYAAGPARPGRPAHPGQVARRAAELPGPHRGRLPEPVQDRRRRQPRSLHQRDSLDRAPRGLDRRLHRLARARGQATIEATARPRSAWVAHVNAVARKRVFLSCNSWYLGANIPGKPRMFMPLAGGFPAYATRCAEVADRATRASLCIDGSSTGCAR